jgi:hypothetical protein
LSRLANTAPLRQREPRVRDKKYLAWLHHGLPCAACAIRGDGAAWPGFRVEAAHIKLGIASRGWTECGRGVRPSDSRCLPLDAWCHRLAPDACDVNQRQFFDRLGLGDAVADLCSELYQAFQHGQDGAAVIRRWARNG